MSSAVTSGRRLPSAWARATISPTMPMPRPAVLRISSVVSTLALAADLGADVTVDYRTHDWSSQVRDAVGTADVVFDGVGGDVGAAAFGLLRAGGRFCPFGMASGGFAPVTTDMARAARVDVRGGGPVSPAESASLSRAALDEAAAGRLRPVIGQDHPLAEAAAAHAAIEARATIGKTLLTVA